MEIFMDVEVDKENSYLDNLDGSFLGFFFPRSQPKKHLIHEKLGLTGWGWVVGWGWNPTQLYWDFHKPL